MADDHGNDHNEDAAFGIAVLKGIAWLGPPVLVFMCLVVWLTTDQGLTSSIVAGLLPGVLLGAFAGGFAGMLRAMKH